MMSLPLQPIGLLAASLYLVAAAVLMARPVLGDGFRYKTRIPAGFFFVGAGMMMAILEVSIVGIVDAVSLTLLGYLLMACGAIIGLHLCWFVVPSLYPEFLAEDDESPDCEE